ncbi:MAG TPA: YceI family protein [Candidatus Polarisedimenticolia bacterium]|nr:YceI family protein [Candidatus Polarisedimenticolia bacterium]
MSARTARPVRSIRPLAVFALTALVTAGVAAGEARAADTYSIDPSHSNVGFTVRHFFSKVPGHFTKYEGTIVYDTQDLSKSTVTVSIDTASIDTEEPKRDAHLKSPDFFDAEKHPKITFVSSKVTPAGDKKVKVDGTLTIRGVSKPVTLDVDLLGTGPDGWGGVRSGFEARTKINRQDFGVAWNKVVEGGGSVLSDEVDIVLNVEAVRQAPKPAEAPKKG